MKFPKTIVVKVKVAPLAIEVTQAITLMSYLDDPKRRRFSVKCVSQVHSQPRYNCRVQGNFVDVLLGPVVRLWHSRRYYSLLPKDSLWTTSRNLYAFVSLGLDQTVGRRDKQTGSDGRNFAEI
jgi:hypothetical protein